MNKVQVQNVREQVDLLPFKQASLFLSLLACLVYVHRLLNMDASTLLPGIMVCLGGR